MDLISQESLLKIFKEDRAVLEGHFLLSSGMHSPGYLQCARVLCHPQKAELLGRALAEKVRHYGIEAVISPAIGGIIIGHETARALGVRHIFAERVNGIMDLRRGFATNPGEKFLVVEDVLTTGGSVMEAVNLVKSLGAAPLGAAAIILRAAETDNLGVPFFHLLKLEIPAYSPADCPLCRSGAGPPVKPGSKGNY